MYFLCIFNIIQLKVLSYSPRTWSYLLINAEISHLCLMSEGQTQSPNTVDMYHRWTKNPRPPSTGQTSSKLHRHFFFHLKLYLSLTAISEVAHVVKIILSAMQLLAGKAIFIYFYILYLPMLEMWITNLALIPYIPHQWFRVFSSPKWKIFTQYYMLPVMEDKRSKDFSMQHHNIPKWYLLGKNHALHIQPQKKHTTKKVDTLYQALHFKQS